MGLFSGIKKAFKSVASVVAEPVEKVLAPIAATGAFGPIGQIGAAVVAPKTTGRLLTSLIPGVGSSVTSSAGVLSPMGTLLPGAQTGLPSVFQPQQFAPQPVAQPPLLPIQQQISPQLTMAAAPQIAAGAAAVASRFARLFPNLFAWIQGQRAAGIPMTLQKLRAMGRRFGVINLVTLGLLTSDLAVDLLISESMGFGKTRRTNFGNITALRRSMRRVEGFHRLCTKADMLRGSRRRGRTRGAGRRNGVVIAQN